MFFMFAGSPLGNFLKRGEFPETHFLPPENAPVWCFGLQPASRSAPGSLRLCSVPEDFILEGSNQTLPCPSTRSKAAVLHLSCAHLDAAAAGFFFEQSLSQPVQDKWDVRENLFFVSFFQWSDFRCERLLFFSSVFHNRGNATEIHLFCSSTGSGMLGWLLQLQVTPP